MIGTLAVLLLATPACPALPAKPACEGVLPVFEAGCATRWVCPADLAAQGLTSLDLSDTWTPPIFREEPSLGEAGKQPYKAVYLKLAAGEVDDPLVEHRAATDRYLEPYGIFPNITVVKARLLDAERHACHDAVDDADLAALERSVSPYEDPAVGRQRVKTLKGLEGQFRRELTRRAEAAAKEAAKEAARAAAQAAEAGIVGPPAPAPAVPAKVEYGPADFAALASEKKWAGPVAKWKKARNRVEAIRGMQEHLKCEGELDRSETSGVFGWNTQLALQIFQRKQFLGARSTLDAESRDHLIADSHELDFKALLRALRERVVAATGLLEDGSAVGRWGQVLGRTLDSNEFRYTLPDVPLPNGAEDAISPATEAAARALGWTTPDAATRWLEARADLASLVVAVKLPPPPPWHSAHMDLRAEVDRGDVWYDYPVGPSGRLRSHPIERRPSNTLYVKHGDQEIALVRWATTIGAWKEERLESGDVVYKYKNSDVGPRIWRHLVTGPSWLPPPSTPDDDLVQRGRKGWEVKTDILGPSYASAFGLVMLIHHQPVVRKSGKTVYFDNGIRSHGSVSYRSIVRGASHGCHRLFNHLAVRLGGFLLAHRPHTVEGNLPVTYGRRFTYKGEALHVKLESRGFGFVFEPPVPVNVLEGRIRGRVRRPPAGSMPVP